MIICCVFTPNQETKSTFLEILLQGAGIVVDTVDIDQGIDVNIPYALSHAVSNGNINVIRLLLKQGVEVNTTNQV